MYLMFYKRLEKTCKINCAIWAGNKGRNAKVKSPLLHGSLRFFSYLPSENKVVFINIVLAT